MPLRHKVARSNDVRAPAVSRGTAVIVGRYRADNPKVALIHPEDLAMLEESHDMLQNIGKLESLPVSDLALSAIADEDRPSPGALIEERDEIEALLDL
jgi:hypothetical protein